VGLVQYGCNSVLNIFDPRLVGFSDAKLVDAEDQLYLIPKFLSV
jgi:hypothetical protein